MSLVERCREEFLQKYAEDGFSTCHIFLSASDMQTPAIIRSASDSDPAIAFDRAWTELSSALGSIHPSVLRAEYVVRAIPAIWQDFLERIKTRGTGFWRQGVAFGSEFLLPFTESELNARGLLIPLQKKEAEISPNTEENESQGKEKGKGAKQKDAPKKELARGSTINDPLWLSYCVERHGKAWTPISYGHRIWIFSTKGILVEEGRDSQSLISKGLHTGRREISPGVELCQEMALSSARWLARQSITGDFSAKTSLEQINIVYALHMAGKMTEDSEICDAAGKTLERFLAQNLQRRTLESGEEAVFFAHEGDALIDLGVCALGCLLLQERRERYGHLLDALYRGISVFQREDNIVSHLLQSDDLSKKDVLHSADYDGLFILALFHSERDDLIERAHNALKACISLQRWQFKSVWLGKAVNCLNQKFPTHESLVFSLNNFLGNVSTAFLYMNESGTLLRLMICAEKALDILENHPDLESRVSYLERSRIRAALKGRLGIFLDSFYWPEFAMYEKHPDSLLGTFFKREEHDDNGFLISEEHTSGMIVTLYEFMEYLRERKERGEDITIRHQAKEEESDIQRVLSKEEIESRIDAFKKDFSERKGTIYCLFDGLPDFPDGLKISALRRAELFHKYLSQDICILTHLYQNTLFEMFVENCKLKRLSQATYMNMYDAFQGINRNRLPPKAADIPSAFGKRRVIPVPNSPDYVITNTGKAGTLYLVVDPKNKKLRCIEHMDKKGRKFQRDFYDTYGFMSRSDFLDLSTGKIQYSTFHRADAAKSVAIREEYDISQEKQTLTRMELVDEHGKVYAEFSNYRDAIEYWVSLITRDQEKNYIILGDNREEYLNVFTAARKNNRYKNCLLLQIIHNNTIGVEYLMNGDDDYLTLPTGELYSFLYDLNVRCDEVITLTRRQKAHLGERYGLNNISVVAHAFPEEDLPKEDEKKESYDPYMVIHVGRLADQKCHEQAIEAFKRVVKEIPEAHLHFYGVGPLGNRLLQRVQQEGLQNNIRFEGFNTNMGEIYDKAACMLVTSIFEGFSLVNLEAISHGCPVVSVDCDYGQSAMIEHEVNGLLSPLGDVGALAKNVVEVLRNRELRARLSQGCRPSMEKFSEPVIAARWAETLHRLLESHLQMP